MLELIWHGDADQASRKELKPRHINVLTVMPGPMDTEMVPRENPRHPDSPIYKLPFIDPSMVARKSLRKVHRGTPTYTTGLFYKCYRILCKLAPHRILIFFNKI